ncbi:helix-turn-helix transcriptional regulator [Actinocorallia sp. B10E7]|uniref:helix-turn-helix domain-containing protein n=1 Tax=Actinocorallia sp. B10E7 TaxID=3153558 RepID=UPI00325CAB8B
MAHGDLARDPLIRAFGAVVRAYREAAGLSRAKLAEALGCSPQWIEKIETGARPPSEATSIDLDTYFKTPGAFHAMWRELKRAGKTVDFPGFPGFVALEAKASTMHIFENMVITGLFQTPEYAYEILKPGRRPDVIEDLVATRLERQRILERESPPEIVLILDETALHRPIGDQQLRKNQFYHLAELADAPNITVQIIPSSTGSYAGLPGAFTLMEFDSMPSAVYIEKHTDGEIIGQTERVRSYALQFSLIRGAAMSAPESMKLLRMIGDTL